MGLEPRPADLTRWQDVVRRVKNPRRRTRIAVVGKYLDLKDSYKSLAEALSTYDGTLVFVSHNRSFVRALATRIWNVNGGKVEDYPGSLDDYFPTRVHRMLAKAPLTLLERERDYDVVATIRGGGIAGQAARIPDGWVIRRARGVEGQGDVARRIHGRACHPAVDGIGRVGALLINRVAAPVVAHLVPANAATIGAIFASMSSGQYFFGSLR